MQHRIFGVESYKALWKILTHPTFRVVAVIVVMALSAWIVVQTQIELRHDRTATPLLFGHR